MNILRHLTRPWRAHRARVARQRRIANALFDLMVGDLRMRGYGR